MFERIAVVLVVSFLSIGPAHAYIDPGTGSMLFSALLCSVTTLFFLFNSIVIFFKRKLFSEKTLAANKQKFVIYSEGNQYYSVFKPVLDEFEARGIPVMYYTSASEDLVFSENYKFVKTQYIGKGNKAYFKLAFIDADVCLMTTPQLDVLQLKRSRQVKHYCHIFHSIGFSMDYHLFSLDYYDSVLCDAEYQIPLIREIENKRGLPSKTLKVVGSTYMDYNKKHIPAEVKSDKFTILIAPSWGDYGLLKRCGHKLLGKLTKQDYKIIVRPHPQSLLVEQKLIDSLQKKYADNNILWDFSNDNLKTMSQADILISDFSCIMMDYAFLFKKPFLYVDTDLNFEIYDLCDLDETPWRNRIVNVIGRKLNIDSDEIDNIAEIIDEIRKDQSLIKYIEDASDYAWQYKGEAAKNVVDFLVEKQQEVCSK